jgi:hypothetical protein
MHFQFGVVQGMTNGLLVRLTEPSFTCLILALVHEEVVLELGRGFHIQKFIVLQNSKVALLSRSLGGVERNPNRAIAG